MSHGYETLNFDNSKEAKHELQFILSRFHRRIRRQAFKQGRQASGYLPKPPVALTPPAQQIPSAPANTRAPTAQYIDNLMSDLFKITTKSQSATPNKPIRRNNFKKNRVTVTKSSLKAILMGIFEVWYKGKFGGQVSTVSHGQGATPMRKHTPRIAATGVNKAELFNDFIKSIEKMRQKAKAAPVSQSKSQTVPQQKLQAVSQQKLQTVSQQKAQTVSQQKAQAVSHQKLQTVSQQKAQAVSHQKLQAVSQQKAHAVSQQKLQAVSQQKLQPVSQSNTQTISQSRSQLKPPLKSKVDLPIPPPVKTPKSLPKVVTIQQVGPSRKQAPAKRVSQSNHKASSKSAAPISLWPGSAKTIAPPKPNVKVSTKAKPTAVPTYAPTTSVNIVTSTPIVTTPLPVPVNTTTAAPPVTTAVVVTTAAPVVTTTAAPTTVPITTKPPTTTTVLPTIDPDLLGDLNEARVAKGLPLLRSDQVDIYGNILPPKIPAWLRRRGGTRRRGHGHGFGMGSGGHGRGLGMGEGGHGRGFGMGERGHGPGLGMGEGGHGRGSGMGEGSRFGGHGHGHSADHGHGHGAYDQLHNAHLDAHIMAGPMSARQHRQLHRLLKSWEHTRFVPDAPTTLSPEANLKLMDPDAYAELMERNAG